MTVPVGSRSTAASGTASAWRSNETSERRIAFTDACHRTSRRTCRRRVSAEFNEADPLSVRSHLPPFVTALRVICARVSSQVYNPPSVE